jgi:hypothetical protein
MKKGDKNKNKNKMEKQTGKKVRRWVNQRRGGSTVRL